MSVRSVRTEVNQKDFEEGVKILSEKVKENEAIFSDTELQKKVKNYDEKVGIKNRKFDISKIRNKV